MRDAFALSWRLAAVLGGEASETLLDSYGPERSEHVQEIIRQAVELGRIICMLDPDEVAARNVQMKAAMKDPSLGLKPPPEPRLGNGVYMASDDNAGYLSIQGQVRHNGHEGLFDDVVGKGWQLLMRCNGAPPVLDQTAQRVIEKLHAVVADFGPGGDTVDLEGNYASWFDRLDADAVLIRPDFYVFGTSSIEQVNALIASVQTAIGSRECLPIS